MFPPSSTQMTSRAASNLLLRKNRCDYGLIYRCIALPFDYYTKLTVFFISIRVKFSKAVYFAMVDIIHRSPKSILSDSFEIIERECVATIICEFGDNSSIDGSIIRCQVRCNDSSGSYAIKTAPLPLERAARPNSAIMCLFFALVF
jgi:hypothetical protein